MLHINMLHIYRQGSDMASLQQVKGWCTNKDSFSLKYLAWIYLETTKKDYSKAFNLTYWLNNYIEQG